MLPKVGKKLFAFVFCRFFTHNSVYVKFKFYICGLKRYDKYSVEHYFNGDVIQEMVSVLSAVHISVERIKKISSYCNKNV